MFSDSANSQPVSLQQLARIFGRHPTTVSKWFDEGLEYRKIGRTRYTTLAAVDRWSAAQSVEAVTPDVVAPSKRLKSPRPRRAK